MTETASDEALVSAIRAGDLQAFDVLYARYSARLFSYVLRLVGDRAVAEDVLQDVFMTVLRDRGARLQPGRFGGWLFTVARNRCLTELRSERRRAARSEAAPAPNAVMASPEGAVVSRQLLGAAFATLSPEHADALLLKELGGLTYREMARVLDVPEGTAKSRLHHAIHAVRDWLRGEEE